MSEENTFRPNSLNHLIGQEHVREVVSTALDYSFQEQVPFSPQFDARTTRSWQDCAGKSDLRRNRIGLSRTAWIGGQFTKRVLCSLDESRRVGRRLHRRNPSAGKQLPAHAAYRNR